MAWVDAPAPGGNYDGSLPDLVPFEVVIKKVEVHPPSPQYPNSGNRAAIIFDTVEYEQQEVRDWVSTKIGQNNSGQVAKMRELINAIHGRAIDAPIAKLEDESLEYSFDGSQVDGQIQPGVRVMLNGRNVEKGQEGQKYTAFQVEHYLAIKKAGGVGPGRAPSAPPSAPAAAGPAPADF